MTNIPQTGTNTLQTIANNGQQMANNRKRAMVWLATLTAITLIGQYVMLANYGFGHTADNLPAWFFVAEKVLWGLRALVEVAVVVYVATTQPDTNNQERNLVRLEILLITLILLTVGPAWISAALQQSIVETVSIYGVYVWGLALAGISATMLAAVGYAYRVQPVDDGHLLVTVGDYQKMLATVGDAEARAAELLVRVGQAEGERDRAKMEVEAMREAVGILRHLPGSAQVQIVAMFADGRPDPQTLAETFGLSESTIRGVLSKLNSK